MSTGDSTTPSTVAPDAPGILAVSTIPLEGCSDELLNTQARCGLATLSLQLHHHHRVAGRRRALAHLACQDEVMMGIDEAGRGPSLGPMATTESGREHAKTRPACVRGGVRRAAPVLAEQHSATAAGSRPEHAWQGPLPTAPPASAVWVVRWMVGGFAVCELASRARLRYTAPPSAAWTICLNSRRWASPTPRRSPSRGARRSGRSCARLASSDRLS